MQAVGMGVVNQPANNLASLEVMRAISLLLELGALQTEISQYEVEGASKSADGCVPIEFVAYKPTPFGRAMLQRVLPRVGIKEDDFRRAFAQLKNN